MRTFSLRLLLSAFLLACLFSQSAHAQDGGPPPGMGGPPPLPPGAGGPPGQGNKNGAKPKPAPTVTVTKKDKTSLRGQITDAEPTLLKIQTKESEVTVLWIDVLSVSNGLTREKAIEQFRKEHGAEICPTCLGEGVSRCPTCKGTGHDPASAKDCATCKGELLVDCKTPGCKEGKIRCTNKACLKRNEGNWHQKDGKMVRDFNTSKGAAWFSEEHLGHLIVKDGDTWVDKGVCPTCGGTQTVSDPVCDGTDKVPCPECIKRDTAAICKDCEKGMVKCPTCQGTGTKKA